jgi:hypothetical protein
LEPTTLESTAATLESTAATLESATLESTRTIAVG